jgi:hypothetical protein
MFEFLARFRPQSLARSQVRRNRLLGVERLETRDCPAAPAFVSLSATQIGASIVVSGNVSDENPISVRIDVSGAGTGTTYADGQGNFQVILTGSASSIHAVALDDESLTAVRDQTVYVPYENQKPIITDLAYRYDATGHLIVTGRVIDEAPVGLTVRFKLNGEEFGGNTTITQETGEFTLDLGTFGVWGNLTCTVTDLAGMTSDTAKLYIDPR